MILKHLHRSVEYRLSTNSSNNEIYDENKIK